MAKKRGGLAGLYDRNKGKFRTVGTLVGTGLGALVGGPAGAKIGGTLAGAAFRGFDREGKGGIGFDVSQGLRGAAEGYGTAALATSAYGGAKNLLSPKAMSAGMGGATGAAGQAGGYGGVGSMPGVGFGLGGTSATTEPIAGLGRAAADRAFGELNMPLSDIANANTRAGTSNRFMQALLNPQVLAGGVQGVLGMLPDAKSAAMEEQTKLGQGQLDLQKAQFEEEKRRAQMEEERRQRIAELLMPLMQQSFSQYYGGGR